MEVINHPFNMPMPRACSGGSTARILAHAVWAASNHFGYAQTVVPPQSRRYIERATNSLNVSDSIPPDNLRLALSNAASHLRLAGGAVNHIGWRVAMNRAAALFTLVSQSSRPGIPIQESLLHVGDIFTAAATVVNASSWYSAP